MRYATRRENQGEAEVSGVNPSSEQRHEELTPETPASCLATVFASLNQRPADLMQCSTCLPTQIDTSLQREAKIGV